MTDEERQGQIDFIIEQQAQLTATVGRLSEKVDRNADGIASLLAIAEIHDREIKDLGASVRLVDERQRHADRRAAETDERLNALINTVERYITGRNGQG